MEFNKKELTTILSLVGLSSDRDIKDKIFNYILKTNNEINPKIRERLEDNLHFYEPGYNLELYDKILYVLEGVVENEQ